MNYEQTLNSVFRTVPAGNNGCIRGDAFGLIDPPQITKHWDLTMCALARSLDYRILVFNRGFDYATFDCCNLPFPIGWGDDYILIDYLPLSRYQKAAPFEKRRNYQLTVVAPEKINLGVYESRLSALVVDARQVRTLCSGEISDVDHYSFGQLRLTLDSSKPNGANYADFLAAINRPEPSKPLAGMVPRPVPVSKKPSIPIDGNGFVRIV
jgi:hypothetical protein